MTILLNRAYSINYSTIAHDKTVCMALSFLESIGTLPNAQEPEVGEISQDQMHEPFTGKL